MEQPREWVSIKEATLICGVSRRTIYNWLKADKLIVKRLVGGGIRIYARSLWKEAPNMDKTRLCTTNGKSVAEVRASQTNETGQHDGYIVLCPDERAKGFVRPYRDSYKHVGVETQLVDDNDDLSHKVRTGGCGTVTRMGCALSETYARDPQFYTATFCVGCNKHLPIAEFVWTADGQQVGS
jgi:hypothetical protein